MQVYFHRTFKKQFAKLPATIQNKFHQRLTLFMTNPAHLLLRVHPLSGKRQPLWSMNVTSDYRALFVEETPAVTFYEIGTHSELYE